MVRKTAALFVAVCLQGPAIAAMAQEAPGTVGEVIRLKVKPGMVRQFEDAGKQHIAWHGEKNDPWARHVWQVTSGPGTGEYIAATFGHKWADFDTATVPRGKDEMDADARVGPYTKSMQPPYVAFLPKHVFPPDDDTPSKFATVVTTRVKQGMGEAYMNALSKIPKAMEKTKWPGHYLFSALSNGGEHPTFFLVLPRQKWADFPRRRNRSRRCWEAYGRQEADSILKTIDKATKSVSSEMLVYRPEMSYVPRSQ